MDACLVLPPDDSGPRPPAFSSGPSPGRRRDRSEICARILHLTLYEAEQIRDTELRTPQPWQEQAQVISLRFPSRYHFAPVLAKCTSNHLEGAREQNVYHIILAA